MWQSPRQELVTMDAPVTYWHQSWSVFKLVLKGMYVHCTVLVDRMWKSRIHVHLKWIVSVYWNAKEGAWGRKLVSLEDPLVMLHPIFASLFISFQFGVHITCVDWSCFMIWRFQSQDCRASPQIWLPFSFDSSPLSFTAGDSLTKKLDVTVKDLKGSVHEKNHLNFQLRALGKLR